MSQLTDKFMNQKLYLAIAQFDCEGGYILGIYTEIADAKSRLDEAKKNKKFYCDKFFTQEVVINQPCLLII